jgi:hypothetical protein
MSAPVSISRAALLNSKTDHASCQDGIAANFVSSAKRLENAPVSVPESLPELNATWKLDGCRVLLMNEMPRALPEFFPEALALDFPANYCTVNFNPSCDKS